MNRKSQIPWSRMLSIASLLVILVSLITVGVSVDIRADRALELAIENEEAIEILDDEIRDTLNKILVEVAVITEKTITNQKTVDEIHDKLNIVMYDHYGE